MAVPVSQQHRNVSVIVWAGAILAAVLLALFLIGGQNSGQPSAPSGPGNPMQKDQGR
jgi:hypothetical protein